MWGKEPANTIMPLWLCVPVIIQNLELFNIYGAGDRTQGHNQSSQCATSDFLQLLWTWMVGDQPYLWPGNTVHWSKCNLYLLWPTRRTDSKQFNDRSALEYEQTQSLSILKLIPPFTNMYGTCEFYCAGYCARFQSQNLNNQWDPGVREALKPITGNHEMCLWWLRKRRVQHQYGLALGALEGCGALFKSPMGGFLF